MLRTKFVSLFASALLFAACDAGTDVPAKTASEQAVAVAQADAKAKSGVAAMVKAGEAVTVEVTDPESPIFGARVELPAAALPAGVAAAIVTLLPVETPQPLDASLDDVGLDPGTATILGVYVEVNVVNADTGESLTLNEAARFSRPLPAGFDPVNAPLLAMIHFHDGKWELFLDPAYDETGNAISGGLKTFSQTAVVKSSSFVADPAAFTTTEDTAVTGTLTASRTKNTIFSIVAAPTKGSVIFTDAETGAFRYTPTANLNGADSFTFKVTRGTAVSSTATVTLTITAVNDAPTTAGSSVTLNEDGSITATLPALDSEGDELVFTKLSNPAHGDVVVDANGGYTYTPAANYFGPDGFTYRVSDGFFDSAPASVAITVTPVYDAPVALALSFAITEDTVFSSAVTAIDIDNLMPEYVVVENPTQGTLDWNTLTGEFTYTPNANFVGGDSVVYYVHAGSFTSENKVATFTVAAVNDAPSATSVTLTTNEDQAISGTLQGNDFADDLNSTSTFTIATPPAHGWLTNVNLTTGAFTYNPVTNYAGVDSFTFVTTDETDLDSLAGTITINMTPVDDAPYANNASFTTAEDFSYAMVLSGGDVDSPMLTYSVYSYTGAVTYTVDADTGLLTVYPAYNWSGEGIIYFSVSDGINTAYANVTYTVTSVNDAPIPSEYNSWYANEDQASGTQYVSASDPDGGSPIYSLASQPEHGTVVLQADGSGTYVGDANFNGSDPFTVSAFDGITSTTFVVPVEVFSNPDSPVFTTTTFQMWATAPATFAIPVTDIDSPFTVSYSGVSGSVTAEVVGTNVTVYPTGNGVGGIVYLSITDDSYTLYPVMFISFYNSCVDPDGDAHGTSCALGTDCDETNPMIHAGAAEIPDDGLDQSCDGFDLAITDATTIFVDKVTGNNANAGTQAAPLRDIQPGIDAAFAASKVVAVAQGTYATALNLNVSMYGGFESAGWTRNPDAYPTIISWTTNYRPIGIEADVTAAVSGFTIWSGGNEGIANAGNAYIFGNRLRNVTQTLFFSVYLIYSSEGSTLYAADNTMIASGLSMVYGANTYLAKAAVLVRNAVTLVGQRGYGLYMSAYSGLADANKISVDGTLNFIGMHAADGNSMVSNNIVEVVNDVNYGYGIASSSGGVQYFINNTIVIPNGGNAFQIGMPQAAVLANNYVNAFRGIIKQGEGKMWVYNNDFYNANMEWTLIVSLDSNDLVDLAGVNACLWNGCEGASGNFFADGALVAPDFDFVSGSNPLIDAGLDPATLTGAPFVGHDVDGLTRPGAGLFDVGAREYYP